MSRDRREDRYKLSWDQQVSNSATHLALWKVLPAHVRSVRVGKDVREGERDEQHHEEDV